MESLFGVPSSAKELYWYLLNVIFDILKQRINDQSVAYMCRFFPSQFRSVTFILSTRATEQWGSRRIQDWGAPSTLW